MATAGERYTERTGNIWSYAHRNDMTGLRAALLRGVDVNIINTVGWTACHAAAAGGSTKALRHLIVKHKADFTISDKGGNLPSYHAAKNGHLHALRLLQELGDDLTKVRLSQCKGKATRDAVIEAYQKANKRINNEDDEYDSADEDKIVGYERKQSKSTAFWGPRRTPISAKIKRKIIKNNRIKKKDKAQADDDDDSRLITIPGDINGEDPKALDKQAELSYQETVQLVKRNQQSKKERRRQQRKMTREMEKKTDAHVASSGENENDSMESRTEEDEDEYQFIDTTNVTSDFAALMAIDSDSSIDSSDL